MKLANARRTGRNVGTASLDHSRRSDRQDSSTFLDAATRTRVALVCNFVNAEVARCRNHVLGVAAACFGGMLLLFIFAGVIDALIVVVIGVGISAFRVVRARRELSESYGRIAIRRLVAAVSKGLTYKATSSLTRDQFDSLDILPRSGNGWRSMHEIVARTGDTTCSLQEICSPSAEREAAGFNGVLIRVSVPTPFSGHTVVLPERDHVSGGIVRAATKRDLVLVKHPEFERLFSAYSTDYAAAKHVLSAALMELIVAAATTIGPDIRMAFVKRSLFVSVPSAQLLPEVSLFSAPLTPEQAAGQVARFLAFAAALARTLTAGKAGQS